MGIDGVGGVHLFERFRGDGAGLERFGELIPRTRWLPDPRPSTDAMPQALDDPAGKGRFTHINASSRPNTRRTNPPPAAWLTSCRMRVFVSVRVPEVFGSFQGAVISAPDVDGGDFIAVAEGKPGQGREACAVREGGFPLREIAGGAGECLWIAG